MAEMAPRSACIAFVDSLTNGLVGGDNFYAIRIVQDGLFIRVQFLAINSVEPLERAVCMSKHALDMRFLVIVAVEIYVDYVEVSVGRRGKDYVEASVGRRDKSRCDLHGEENKCRFHGLCCMGCVFMQKGF